MSSHPSRPAPPRVDPALPVPAWLDAHADGAVLRVAVVPNASRSALAGLHGDALRVRIAAVPLDGRANEALLDFLADALGLPRRAGRIDAGHGARRKRIVVALAPAHVVQRLQPLLDEAAVR
jgi:hypothetical protein